MAGPLPLSLKAIKNSVASLNKDEFFILLCYVRRGRRHWFFSSSLIQFYPKLPCLCYECGEDNIKILLHSLHVCCDPVNLNKRYAFRNMYIIQVDQLNMAIFFWYFVLIDVSSVFHGVTKNPQYSKTFSTLIWFFCSSSERKVIQLKK